MAETMGTAWNAKMVEIQMKAAAAYLGEALKAIRIAQEAIENGENDADEKLPEFTNLKGLLSIAHATANRTANNWADYRMAREKH